MATDDIIIDGKQFYLMEHQEYHRQVAYIILDSYGKMIMEECQNGFDEKTKQKLHELMKVPEQRNKKDNDIPVDVGCSLILHLPDRSADFCTESGCY